MFSKCANAECPASFEHHLKGRIFRFRQSPVDAEKAPNTHHVVHFWLCEGCARVYDLKYRDGVCRLIRLHYEELPEVKLSRLVSAA